MKIAVDLTSIPNQKTGMGRYAVGLISALGNFDKKNEYWLFVKKYQAKDFSVEKDNFHIVLCNNILNIRILRILWEQFVLPFMLYKNKIDILHSIHYTTSFFAPCKQVVTFPDMTFFLFPEKHIFIKRLFFRAMILFSVKKAKKIIAISESTKKDIQKILNVSSEKIKVVYLDVDDVFSPLIRGKETEEIKKNYGIKNDFILYVGVLEPRKNVVRLIKAYNGLVEEKKIKHQLVLVGKKGWDYDEIFNVINDLNLQSKIICTGYVSEKNLNYLYNAADIFIYPSLYEGFGIPLIEAFACGVPVISSNISSIPEVVGNAGILVDPYNVRTIKEAIYGLLKDKNLRSELRKRGLQRAKYFSKERLAFGMMEAYKETDQKI